MWMNVLESLIRREYKPDGSSSFVPVLAEKWETTDAKTWTFTLRKGVKFSDGTEFTSADVVYSWNKIMTDQDSKQQGQLKSYVASMEAPDPYTFKVILKQPNATILDEMHNRVIVSKAHYEKVGKDQADRSPIGTGPYLFKEWVQGQRFVVTRNANYWGQQPQADEVIYRFIFEDEAKVTALTNGEVDIIQRIAPQLVERISGRAHAESVYGLRHMFFGMRPDMAPTDNKLVRQAIYHAIDRQAIAEQVQSGYATVLNGPLQSFVFGYDPKIKSYDYNPAKAKELLAQAGHPNGLTLDLYIPTTQYTKAKEVGQAAVGMLKNVGITANMQTPEWGTYSNEYNAGKYGFYMIGRGDVSDPSVFLVQYFQTGGSKRLGYSNPKVDELLTKQQSITDEKERIAVLAEAQEQIMEDAPAVFLYTYKDIYGVANHLDWKPWPNEYIWGYKVNFKS
jgi:peptide/nickel transport system substrate-binding protein